MNDLSFSKIMLWVGRAFVWGIGVFTVYFFFDAIVDEFIVGKSIWVVLLFYVSTGGIIMSFSDKINNYKE